jgi:AmmeMemoRadiSam system protein B
MYKKQNKYTIQKLRSNSSSSSSSDDSYDLIQTNIKKKALQKTHNIITFNPPYNSSWFETEINNNSTNNSNSKISIKDYIKKLFNICKIHLDANVKPDTTKAIIVPHAGIRYSGLCSASAYQQLTNRITPIKRIILFCTHHKASNNIIAPSFTHIKPLLGNIPLKIDTELIETLKPFLEINNSAFDEEHSFFNQLPFIESIISSSSNVLITPFLISNSMILNKANCDKLHKAMDILKSKLQDKGTILICTSDFSHINGHFKNKITSNIQQNIRNQDSQILQFIYNNLNGVVTKSKKIDDILFIQNAPSCGTMAMYLFAKLLNYHSGAKESSSSSSSDESNDSISYKISNSSKILYPRITCYYTSQIRDEHIDIFNFTPEQLTSLLPIDLNNKTTESSVSYIGIIFTSQPNIEDKNDKKKTIRKLENLLSQYEKQTLLGFIKEYLFFKFSMPKYKIPTNLINPINSKSFKLDLGVGITVYININTNKKLRNVANIIGNPTYNSTDNDEFQSIESKIRNIIDKLINNSNTYKNLKFASLNSNEYNKLTFEISIFNKTTPITLNDYFNTNNKFNLGTDGIIIINNDIDKKTSKNKLLTPNSYSLTNIEETLNPSISKKDLLEELCDIQMQNETSKKECYNLSNISLFYNEGLVFS